MSNASLQFLLFIVAATVVFWSAPERWRFRALMLVTIVVLVAVAPVSAAILGALTVSTGLLTRGQRLSGGRTLLALLPAAASLVGFKVLSAAAGDDVLRGTIIPLGLSFYTLRCIHFVFERYLGRVDEQALRDVAEYLFFLPTIVLGPIHRYPAFDRDRRRHRWDPGLFSEGLERIVYGYFKIIVVGNFLILRVYGDWVTDIATPETRFHLYLTMWGTGLGLYMQFSGASDIAIGFARLLGMRVIENFNWPFFSTSLPQFWQRWHISLTSLVREYVYGWASAVTRSAPLAAVATMLVIGLWHEMSLRYLLWGIYHGVGIAIWQAALRYRSRLGQPHATVAVGERVFGCALTIHFVMLGFLLVRQPDVAAILAALRILATGG